MRNEPHFYAVIDFECTCWENDDPRKEAHEIIEFPVIFMNSRTLEVEYEFHEFVRPTESPVLTPFCTELTGITQATVDAAMHLEAVLHKLEEFMKSYKILSFMPCTDGPWDFSKFLMPELERKKLPIPAWTKKYLDVRREFQFRFNLPRWVGVSEMLGIIGTEFEGRPHSGLDDARNIARIVRAIHNKRGKGKLRENRTLKRS
jgi:3'-5' exoribonuclease 1